MKSNLWKQRREQDGRLVSIWKELKAEKETNSKWDGNQKSSHEEEERSTEDIEDPWLEDINLTEAERSKLMELEQWYLTSERSTNLANPSESPANIGIQPSGTPKQALHEDKQLLPIEVNKTRSFPKTSSLRPTLVNQPTCPTTVTPTFRD